MPAADSADIVIVGGGLSGLAAAGALAHAGRAAVVLDESAHIGAAWSGRYDRLHLHTLRRFSSLPHWPMPATWPRYVSKDQFAAYLGQYAEHFRLDVRLNRRVSRVSPSSGRWQVDTDTGTLTPRVVIMATGRHREPVMPDWPGRASCQATVLHSSAYRRGNDFEGRRVLVVGIGNSGAEIAVDLADAGAAFVGIAVRSRPPILPRDLFGLLPAHLIGLACSALPFPAAVDGVGRVVRRLGSGDLGRYGLGPEAWGPFTARRPPVIDVGFLAALRAGQVHVRPGIVALFDQGAVFADGRREAFDAIVAATGYHTALGRVLAAPEAITPDGRPRFPSGQQTPLRGLYFLGYGDSTRGAIYEANRDARRLAAVIGRDLS